MPDGFANVPILAAKNEGVAIAVILLSIVGVSAALRSRRK
jgi:hypothetical protein